MKSFKDLLSDDVNNVFMNKAEFAEEHIIGDRGMTIIVDEAEIFERSKKQIEQGRIEGVYKRQIMFYVSKKIFGRMPAIGSVLKVDGMNYRVTDAVDEGGVYSITVGYFAQ
ncbi:hypothetical protein ACOAOT_23880 [Lacrimispora sp. AGF001]|uniref:hypothetical protein n=1 Tax=Lacrimispora sp. AGF001 TaxID=3401631 RepID=UPI003B428D50